MRPLRRLTKWLTGGPTRTVFCSHTLGSCARGECVLAQSFATTLRNTSPTTVPRTSPSGFARAVIRPSFTACNSSSGIKPLANCPATSPKSLVQTVSARRGFKCSAVIPDGPAAAPLRAVRKFCNNALLRTSSGSASRMERSIGVLTTRGLRVSSFNNFSVLESPGAIAAPSNACRAEDNSPN